MDSVTPYATLVDVPDREAGIALLKKIEWCGRISHRSEDAQGPDTWERFIRSVVLGHGDWSIVEHASVTVDALVDRGVSHEWVRHRLASYTQESTRFVNYEKKLGLRCIEPPWSISADMAHAWHAALDVAACTYARLLSEGVPPQFARSALPHALATRLITTANVRSWRHFLLMRTTKETHPQMRQVTLPLLAEFQAKVPILFEDIAPEARQVDNLKKMR